MENGRLPESAVETLGAMRTQADADLLAAKERSELERKLLIAQIGEREAKSKLRQLELERESGRFVELALVQRDAADTRERILGVLRSIPQRTALALECACVRAAVVEKRISDEVERAIAQLAESSYGGSK